MHTVNHPINSINVSLSQRRIQNFPRGSANSPGGGARPLSPPPKSATVSHLLRINLWTTVGKGFNTWSSLVRCCVPRSMNINPDLVKRGKNVRIGTEFYFSFCPKTELGDSNCRNMYRCKFKNNPIWLCLKPVTIVGIT